MPRKPTSPPSHWRFPKEGAPYFVSDDLPEDSEELEHHVTVAFTGRLVADGRQVEHLPRPDEWPDALLVVDGVRVGVELVEVVDPTHRRQVMGLGWYLDEIAAALRACGCEDAVAGMTLQLFDGYRPLPAARSKAARQLVSAITSQFCGEHADTFRTSEPQIWRQARFTDAAADIMLAGHRVSTTDPDYDLRWNGAYAVDELCLARTVAGKIDQHYSSHAAIDEVWLLAWDSFGYMITSNRGAAQEILSAASHPFAQVWTTYLGGGDLVSVEPLWPAGVGA